MQSVKIKYWLESNKIYFETLAALLLGGMAIVVSIAQLNISQIQTELTKSQTELAKSQLIISQVQVSPQIHVEAEYILDGVTGRPIEDRINISNLGFPLVTAYNKTIVFLKAKVIGQEPLSEEKSLFIALNGYYGASVLTGQAQGLIYSTYSNKNNSKFGELYKGFISISEANRYSGYIELERYVNVQYTTHIGTVNEQYFKVDMVGGAVKLEKSDGEEIFKVYNSQFPLGKLENFSSLTPNKLWSLMKVKLSK